MSSGSATVDRWIADIERLPQELKPEAFAQIAETEVKRTAAVGTTPDGVPWPERKDGGRALANAADKITSVVSGQSVSLVLTGPDAIHNDGTSKDPVRRVLPTKITPTMSEKLKAGFAAICRRVTGV